jgi:SpoVK/Ycf46/Vps4 family AAA+-type ATPase
MGIRRQPTVQQVVLAPDRSSLEDEVLRAVKTRQSKLTTSPGGVTVLFSGPRGTGKTLAAEVLASELRLELQKVDLSQVVSKFLGETEKNLSRIFDAAEASGSILFFDEADALFGRRSDVKDSHDRFANQEVQFLLQRIETHEGIAILATNCRKQMEPRLLERAHIVVDFPESEATRS